MLSVVQPLPRDLVLVRLLVTVAAILLLLSAGKTVRDWWRWVRR